MKRRTVILALILMMVFCGPTQGQEKILNQFERAGIWKVDRANHRCLVYPGVWKLMPLDKKEGVLRVIYSEENTWWKLYDGQSGELLGEVSSWGISVGPKKGGTWMWFVGWIFLSILVGIYASRKKRSGAGWFFLSLIISPLISFVIVAVLGIPKGELKKCPKCAEEVKIEAQVCRFCGFDFSSTLVAESKPLPSIPSPKKVDTEVHDLAADYINRMSKKT